MAKVTSFGLEFLSASIINYSVGQPNLYREDVFITLEAYELLNEMHKYSYRQMPSTEFLYVYVLTMV